jgi:hypothetical protein
MTMDEIEFNALCDAAIKRQGGPPSSAYHEFMITTPHTPAHLEYMARARSRYPKLPPGAQQIALYILERDGVKAAAAYASRARSRWHVASFVFKMPARSNRGICTYSIKELDERLARYRAHMAEGLKNLEPQRRSARSRKQAGA